MDNQRLCDYVASVTFVTTSLVCCLVGEQGRSYWFVVPSLLNSKLNMGKVNATLDRNLEKSKNEKTNEHRHLLTLLLPWFHIATFAPMFDSSFFSVTKRVSYSLILLN